ncbi:unnamed protein product [Phytomonas sp. EM1]|nr:unnamed protein product [Phytomonas sp. EM1]|eukprot:CCW64991.1 unnamed protein product [Phytomonas sp. isolate EM1]
MSDTQESDFIPIQTVKAWMNASVVMANKDLMTKSCQICKEFVCRLCVHCNSKHPLEEDCTVSHGACGHYFHTHCIDPWLLKGQSRCPSCDKAWEKERVITI